MHENPTLIYIVAALFAAFLIYQIREFIAIALMLGGIAYAYQIYTNHK